MENEFIKVTVDNKEQLINKSHIVRIYSNDKSMAVIILSNVDQGSHELVTQDDYEFLINSLEG